MKILLISPKMDNPNGGIAVWTELYLEGCQTHSLNCDVLNTSTIGKRAINGEAGRNFFDEFIRTTRIFKKLKKFIKKNDYNVIHLNSSCGTFGVIRDYLIIKKIKKLKPQAKIISHFHCDIPHQIHNKISKKYLKKLSKLSDKRLVLCENSKNYLKDEFNLESIKVSNFINENNIAKKPRSFNESIKKAFFVGRISVDKGAFEIYEMARYMPNITFELAGAVAEDVGKWDKPDNVILLGLLEHNEILHKMDEADVFIFPSHTEGFSVALMEAMARGLPSIVTDVGANKDMVENNGGIVVPLLDVDCLKNAFSVMDNRAKRESMSAWCVKKVKSTYTTDEIMKSIISSYMNI